MFRVLWVVVWLSLAVTMAVGCGGDADGGNGSTGTTGVPDIFTDGYFIADHQATRLETVPGTWLAAAKGLKVHLMGRSHSTQVTHGMESLAAGDATLAMATGWFTLPDDAGKLCIYGAQAGTPYCDFEFYLNNADGIPGNIDDAQNIHAALARAPRIDVSVFYWCRDLEGMSAAAVDAYLVAIAALEAQYPNVKFVYVTGNADADGEAGHRRHENNERIRAWVRLGNDRFLFDYESIITHHDSGSAWTQETYAWNGTNVPFLHPQYDPAVNGPEYAYTHANEAGCRATARAFWFLLARIAGWTGD